MNDEIRELALKIFLAQANRLPQYAQPDAIRFSKALAEASFDYARAFLEVAKDKRVEEKKK